MCDQGVQIKILKSIRCSAMSKNYYIPLMNTFTIRKYSNNSILLSPSKFVFCLLQNDHIWHLIKIVLSWFRFPTESCILTLEIFQKHSFRSPVCVSSYKNCLNGECHLKITELKLKDNLIVINVQVESLTQNGKLLEKLMRGYVYLFENIKKNMFWIKRKLIKQKKVQT